MLETILMLSSAVAAMVEFSKSVLVKIAVFGALDEQAQSIVLQVLAFIFGAVAALAWNVNAFPLIEGQAGVILTGLIAATGSAGIHVILSWLGIRVGVVADLTFKEDTRAQAAGTAKRKTYSPFM